MKCRAVLTVATTVVLLMGCTSTTAGDAVKAVGPNDSDGADVAMMDTGPYAITTGPPFPNAGAVSPASGNIIEAQRMAEHVTGPWQVQAELRARGDGDRSRFPASPARWRPASPTARAQRWSRHSPRTVPMCSANGPASIEIPVR